MCIAFGWLMPFAAILPRCFRGALASETVHRLHRNLMLIASILVIIGLVLSFSSVPSYHVSDTHHVVGTILGVLVLQQPINGLLRPRKEEGVKPTSARKWWRGTHMMIGGTILSLGVYQAVSGSSVSASAFSPV